MDEGQNYADAGVNIDEAQASLDSVRDAIAASHNENVLGGIGGFGAMFNAQFPGIERPILVSSIDGVGTKTIVAQMTGDYSGLGHDIVNHCVNDILCQGARPLYFLDYFGCSRLERDVFNQIVSGAAAACAAVNCALIGGETAEMPGVYHDGEVDIVGCITGVVDEAHKLPRPPIVAGDRLVGLASNGLHTNGYSLARKVLFHDSGLTTKDPVPGDPESTSIGEALLRPHTCYFNSVYPLLQSGAIKAIAHITGGGLYDNLPRVLPLNVQAKINRRAWTALPIFEAIQALGNIPEPEMCRAFNMGIGMILVVDPDHLTDTITALNESGTPAAEIGKLQSGPQDVQIV
ncbi:phosphoribosylformylglycinamidine cyclo-ligase [bacterium]|nr:phosphoribosylformylglycinamidine cyclo-ligase [bacterium]